MISQNSYASMEKQQHNGSKNTSVLAGGNNSLLHQSTAATDRRPQTLTTTTTTRLATPQSTQIPGGAAASSSSSMTRSASNPHFGDISKIVPTSAAAAAAATTSKRRIDSVDTVAEATANDYYEDDHYDDQLSAMPPAAPTTAAAAAARHKKKKRSRPNADGNEDNDRDDPNYRAPPYVAGRPTNAPTSNTNAAPPSRPSNSSSTNGTSSIYIIARNGHSHAHGGFDASTPYMSGLPPAGFSATASSAVAAAATRPNDSTLPRLDVRLTFRNNKFIPPTLFFFFVKSKNMECVIKNEPISVSSQNGAGGGPIPFRREPIGTDLIPEPNEELAQDGGARLENKLR